MARVVKKTNSKTKKVSSVVKNPVAKDATDVKKSAEELIKLDDEAKKKIEEINKELKTNENIIKSIKESKLTQKEQLKNINNQLQEAYKIDVNAGLVTLTEKQEKEYRGFVYKLNHAHDEVTDTQAQYGYTDKDKNPLYVKYTESKKELDEAKASLKEKGFSGSGVYKKVKHYPNKIVQLENEIGEYKKEIEKIPPELRKLLGSDTSIYEKQVRGLSAKLNTYQQQKDKLEKEQKETNDKREKAENNNIDIRNRVNTLELEKLEAQERKKPLNEEKAGWLAKKTIELDEEDYIETTIYRGDVLIEHSVQTTKIVGDSSQIKERNWEIYKDIFNFIKKSCGGFTIPRIFMTYANSHKLYYDKKTKHIEYYDKEGDGWGLFENQKFCMDYEVEYPKGPRKIMNYMLSSHGIIEMAERGRSAYVAHVGKHSASKKISIPGAELVKNSKTYDETGKFVGRSFTDDVEIEASTEGYFGIGLRSFVKETIAKYRNEANSILDNLRKDIDKENKIIIRCNKELKSINLENTIKNNTNIITSCKRKSTRISKELLMIDKSMEDLQKKLDDLNEANRIDTEKTKKINEKLREKRKYQQWLGNYKEQMDYIAELEEKTERLRVEAKEKYMEMNRKKLTAERKKALETIPKNKKYQKYKKFHEEHDEQNAEIKRKNIEERTKTINTLERLRADIDQSPQREDRIKALEKRNAELREEKRRLKQGVQVKKEEVFEKAENLEKKLPEVKVIKTEAKKEAVETAVEEVKEEVQTEVDEEINELDKKADEIIEIIKDLENNIKTAKNVVAKKILENRLRNKNAELDKIMNQITEHAYKYNK